jgi:hypothetical protein
MKQNNKQETMQEEFDPIDIDIANDDYGFIFDADGELKSVFLPDNIPFKVPKNIQRILKIAGIRDIDDITGDHPLH